MRKPLQRLAFVVVGLADGQRAVLHFAKIGKNLTLQEIESSAQAEAYVKLADLIVKEVSDIDGTLLPEHDFQRRY